MRDIEFRAWGHWEAEFDKDSNIYFTDNKSMKHLGIINGLDEMHPDPSQLIFMQYTGLKDAHGAKIFEGDIVKFNGMIGLVIGEVRISDEGQGTFLIVDGSVAPFFADMSESTKEVIGNIYENPELLEQSK